MMKTDIWERYDHGVGAHHDNGMSRCCYLPTACAQIRWAVILRWWREMKDNGLFEHRATEDDVTNDDFVYIYIYIYI